MICDSYLNLPLISGVPRKVYNGVYIVFSLLNDNSREKIGANKRR